MGRYFGKVFWEGILGRYFGQVFWEGILGRYFGKVFWEGILGRYFGKVFWAGILGRYYYYFDFVTLPCGYNFKLLPWANRARPTLKAYVSCN